jgi:hypothetical protein
LETSTAILKEGEDAVQFKMRKSGIKVGGRYKPVECQSQHKVVVPMRNRTDNLTVFLRYMHPFLQRQPQLHNHRRRTIWFAFSKKIFNQSDSQLKIYFHFAQRKIAIQPGDANEYRLQRGPVATREFPMFHLSRR